MNAWNSTTMQNNTKDNKYVETGPASISIQIAGQRKELASLLNITISTEAGLPHQNIQSTRTTQAISGCTDQSYKSDI